MKANLVQLLFRCCIFICIVSCKKDFDSSFAVTEESGDAYFPISFSLSQQERPFKGRIIGSFVSTPTSNPAIYNSVANANGNVTHLGVFSKVTTDMINVVSSSLEGTFIMTSPGGEQLAGKYSGTFSFGTAAGSFSWNLNATITGGSGRFSNATGEFVFLANGNYIITDGVVSGNYTETFDGTINY